MDRFLMRISLGYPDRNAERRILSGEGSNGVMETIDSCMTLEDVQHIQKEVANIHASEHFLTYLQDILEFTRSSPEFHIGLSPRAGIALLSASRAWAYIRGRDYTLPEDLQEVLPWTAGHRLKLNRDLGHLQRGQLMEIFSKVPVPV
jgi:MoxR-like ATPase